MPTLIDNGLWFSTYQIQLKQYWESARDPVVSASGDDSTGFVLLSDAASTSGGVLIEGVLEDGTPVQYLQRRLWCRCKLLHEK